MELSRDGWLLLATCGVRSFAYGFLSVILGLYLDGIGLNTTAIAWIFTAALAGAVMTIIITSAADSLGRKNLLILGGALMAGAGLVFALTERYLFRHQYPERSLVSGRPRHRPSYRSLEHDGIHPLTV
jgi:MFS family permease